MSEASCVFLSGLMFPFSFSFVRIAMMDVPAAEAATKSSIYASLAWTDVCMCEVKQHGWLGKICGSRHIGERSN